ncbi:hypothetical protein BH09PSE5_BH09PSE5_03100 [soil metagenome]
MLPVSSEDIDLDPPDNALSAVLRNLALSVLVVCGLAQLVNFLVAA